MRKSVGWEQGGEECKGELEWWKEERGEERDVLRRGGEKRGQERMNNIKKTLGKPSNVIGHSSALRYAPCLCRRCQQA